MDTRKGGIGKPPHKCFTIRPMDVLLVCGTIASAILVVQAVLHKNPSWFPPLDQATKPELLSVDIAVTILIAVLGVLVAERHFNKSAIPMLQTSMVDPETVALRESKEEGREHRCFLRNLGSGPAVIRKVGYRLIFFGEDGKHQPDFDLNFVDLVEALGDRGLAEHIDFYMPRIAEHCTFLAPGTSLVIHVSNERFASEVKYLDMHLTFENALGQRYMKDFPILSHYRPSLKTSVRVTGPAPV